MLFFDNTWLKQYLTTEVTIFPLSRIALGMYLARNLVSSVIKSISI